MMNDDEWMLHQSESGKFKHSKVKEINHLLAKWDESGARFWEYSVSHLRLEIRLEKQNYKGNAHLRCLGCLKISGPTEWADTCVRVAMSSDTTPFIVFDAEAGIMVTCERVDLIENVEPIY